MSIFDRYQARYDAGQEEEMSLQEYLDLCKRDPTAYASVAERMLMAIGEPQLLDTRSNPRLSRIFANKVIRITSATPPRAWKNASNCSTSSARLAVASPRWQKSSSRSSKRCRSTRSRVRRSTRRRSVCSTPSRTVRSSRKTTAFRAAT